MAYLMAAASPSFSAAVTYYGGSIFRSWGEGPTPFDRTAEISCPIQGHFGELDKNPSLGRHAQARRRAYKTWEGT